MTNFIMKHISRRTPEVALDSLHSSSEHVDSDENIAKRQWLSAIRSYDSIQLKDLLNEGNVSTNWTYKSGKKLKHTSFLNRSISEPCSSSVKESAKVGTAVDDWELTCLDVAITTNDSELLELYWSQLEDDVSNKQLTLNRALSFACRSCGQKTDNSKIIIQLLSLGAQPNYRYGDVPVIILAICSMKVAAVEHMLELDSNLANAVVMNDSNIDKHKYEGLSTSLHHASAVGSVELVRLLIQSGADPRSLDDENGDVFFYAKNESVCEVILKEYALIEGKESLITLPLHGIVNKGFINIFKKIVDQCITVTSDQVTIDVTCLQSDCEHNTPESEEYSPKKITLLQFIASRDNNDSLLDYLPIKALVDHFMWKYGYIFLSLRILQFLLFLVAMTFSLILAADLPNPNMYDGSSLSIARGICEIYFVIANLLNSTFELIEFFLIWKQNFNIQREVRGTKLRRYGMFAKPVAICLAFPPTVIDYVTDWYNVIDFLSGFSLIIYLPVRLSNNPSQWIIASIVYFFNSIIIFKYLTVSPFATYVHIIISTLFKDLPKFILTFIFPILTFGGAFFISLRYVSALEDAAPNETLTPSRLEFRNIFLANASYLNTLLAEFRILVEQGSVIKTFYLLGLNWLAALYLFVFTFFTLLVARAIFIAQLSNTYARSKSHADKISTKFRLDFLARLMGHGSIVSVLFNVNKLFFIDEIVLTRKHIHESFESDYQRYYGDSAKHEKELADQILERVSTIVSSENAKQQEFMIAILAEIKSTIRQNSSHLRHPPLEKSDSFSL